MTPTQKALLGLFRREGQTVDVVVARPIDGKSVEAITPYGYSLGLFDGRGNIVFENGIACLGIAETSEIYGMPVQYGVCSR